MQRALVILAFLPAVFSTSGYATAQEVQKSLNPDTPEVDVCRSSGLIALKEVAPTVKDVAINPDSIRIFKMNKKIGDETVHAVVIGEVSIEKAKSSKPQSLVCIIGDKGKVLVTEFSSQ
jgi:hypothetical protein